jgi:hypothetical protein
MKVKEKLSAGEIKEGSRAEAAFRAGGTHGEATEDRRQP